MTELTPIEKKLKDLPLNNRLEVEWADAKSTDAWMEQSELKEKTDLCEIKTVGYLVRDKIYSNHPFHIIVLALSLGKFDPLISQTITIPVSCISKIIILVDLH